MDWLKPLNPRGEASAGDNNDTQVAWLRVMQGQASAGQIAVSRKVFATHLADISLSLAGYHAVTYNLPDGSRLRIVSNSGIHHATLWPTSAVPVPKLPHGFAAVTNWAAPKIFKRVVTIDPPSVEWKTDPIPVPQCATDLEGDNQVFRATSATAYFNHPMVLTDGATRSRWDYLKHRAPALASPNPVVPLCTQAGADYNTRVVHYGVDNAIKNGAGVDIYTMTLSSAILIVEPEEPTHVPAATTASGSEVVLQHIRLAIISPTFGIYTARFANERLARLDEASYSLTERNVVEFTGPIGSSTPPASTVLTDLNEELRGVTASRGVVGAAGSSLPAFTWVQGFYFEVIDLTGADETTETAHREQETFSAASPTTYSLTVALPAATSVEYPDIVVATNATGSVFWRTGFKKKLVDPSGAPLFGTRWYGTYGQQKERIDTEYARTTNPVTSYDLGWAELRLFEGTSVGACTGKTHINTVWIGRSASLWDGDVLSATYVVAGVPPPPPDLLPYLIANNILTEVTAEVAPYPNWTTIAAEAGEILFNERPVNTGEYIFTSRYVIDFDHKGQFYAAIKVIVDCSGAEWQESGVYEGDMTEFAQPSYTVDIYLETNWKGAVANTLLTTASGTRPAFEFATVLKQNPYYFLAVGHEDKQEMVLRIPPSFGLPAEAITQIKTIATHQGTNPHLVCADVRDDITGPAVAKTQSTAGIEFSTIEGGAIRPHMKYVTGQLYARTFRLSDFADALWLLHSTKCDAKENDGATGPDYFYMPALKTTIDTVDFHVEVRDGVHETWSDEIAPGPGQPADPVDRNIKLYRV